MIELDSKYIKARCDKIFNDMNSKFKNNSPKQVYEKINKNIENIRLILNKEISKFKSYPISTSSFLKYLNEIFIDDLSTKINNKYLKRLFLKHHNERLKEEKEVFKKYISKKEKIKKSISLYDEDVLDVNENNSPRGIFDQIKDKPIAKLVPAIIYATSKTNLLAQRYHTTYNSFIKVKDKNNKGKVNKILYKRTNKKFDWCGSFLSFISGIRYDPGEANKRVSTLKLYRNFSDNIVNKNNIKGGDVITVNRLKSQKGKKRGSHIAYVDKVIRDKKGNILQIITLEGNTGNSGKAAERNDTKLKDIALVYRGIVPNYN